MCAAEEMEGAWFGRTRRPRPGFTLVELLAVVGIIAVLLSILTPAIAHIRGQAQLVKCQSNLRQIGIAAALYQTQFNNWLPRDAFSASSAFFAPCLRDALNAPKADETVVTYGFYTGQRVQVDPAYCAQWLRQVEVFKCPAVNSDAFPLHYAVNSMDFDTFIKTGNYSEAPWQKVAGIRGIDRAAYVVEVNMTTLSPDAIGQFNICRADDLPYYVPPNVNAGKPTPKPRMIAANDRRHRGKTAVLLFDGGTVVRNLTDPGDWPESVMNPAAK
jgi:prepilin-type N-terminal cleavage/methylation domain-containing protein